MLHVEEGKSGIGVTVPDLPAVSSAGGSFEEALANAAETILVYLEVLAEDGHDLPVPRGGLPELEPGQVLAIVNVDLSKMEIEPARRKAVRLNVSIPSYAVNLIDQAAASLGASRKRRSITSTGASAVADRRMPPKAPRYSTPATHTAGGRQLVVIAAGGGRQGPRSGSRVPGVRPARIAPGAGRLSAAVRRCGATDRPDAASGCVTPAPRCAGTRPQVHRPEYRYIIAY